MGEPSALLSGQTISISQIAQTSSSDIKKCKTLVRIGRWAKAKTILELGTNLGIATTAFCENDFKVSTVEGQKELYYYAAANLSHYVNCQLYQTTFVDFLKSDRGLYDMIYIDGDHSYSATKLLFNKSKYLLNPEGIIIIDDIRWSGGMKSAWRDIRRDKDFNLIIDLFFMGLVTNRNALKSKIICKLLPRKIKPWPFYFFRKLKFVPYSA